MIIYRPQRGSLSDAMTEKQEFESEEDMKNYIVEEWGGFIQFDDIVIYGEAIEDKRIGWIDTRSVCTNKFGGQDNIEKYGYPQCIGFCATNYR